MRQMSIVEWGQPLPSCARCRRPCRAARRCWSRSRPAASAIPTSTSGRGSSISAPAGRCGWPTAASACPSRDGARDRRPRRGAGTRRDRRHGRRALRRLPVDRLRRLRGLPARGEELLCLTPRTQGTRRDGGYGDHVIVPHARYLVSYDGVRELAATCTCSGITRLQRAAQGARAGPRRLARDHRRGRGRRRGRPHGAGGDPGPDPGRRHRRRQARPRKADGRRGHRRQRRAGRGEAGAGAAPAAAPPRGRFRRRAGDDAVRDGRAAQGREARHGRALRRRAAGLDRDCSRSRC